MLIQRLICLVIGYAFGLFQTSYIIGRTHNIDIRKVGSGNAGTTNTLRVLGKRAGFTTLICDVLKCLLATWVVSLLFQRSGREILPLLKMYAAAGCVLGHNYPFYLDFKGGKGVAASLGMVLSVDWRAGLLAFGLFLVIFFTTHYVSLGSICGYLLAFFLIVIFGAMGLYRMNLAHTLEMDVIMGLLTLQVLIRHRENIRRLRAGTERKTYIGHQKSDE